MDRVVAEPAKDGHISEENFKEALKMFYMMEAHRLILGKVSYVNTFRWLV